MTDGYFQTYAELRANLRLTDIPDGSDAELQLQAAVRESWTTMWRELTNARIVALATIPHVEPPVTDNDQLRLLAEATEVNVIRRHLFLYFSAAFNEGRSPIQEWNTEGLFRNVTQFNIDAKIRALNATIAEAIEVLKGQETIGEEAQIKVGVPTTDDHTANGPIALGESVFGKGGFYNGGLQ